MIDLTNINQHHAPQDGYRLKRRVRPHPSSWWETFAMRLRRYGQTRHTLLRNLLVAPITEVRVMCAGWERILLPCAVLKPEHRR